MRFKKIYLEITNACNLHCSFCSASSRKTGFISLSSFLKIMADIQPFTDHIYLHVKGEPLLHPQLKEMLDICLTYNFKVNLVTNGTLITKSHQLLLAGKAIRQVNFSLHSCEENIKQLSVDHYIDSILGFTENALKSTDMIISLRFWNWHSEDKKLSSTNKLLFEAIEKKFHLPYKLENTVIAGEGLKIQHNLYVNTDFEFVWPSLDHDYENTTGFCYGMRDQAAILLDGTVVPCCLDGEGVISLGNIYDQPFSEIIGGERASRLFEGFSQKKAIEKLCIKCQFKNRFR